MNSNLPAASENEYVSEEEQVIEAPTYQNNQIESGTSGWWKFLGTVVVVGGLVAGGFYLGNNYQIIWNSSWPFIPTVVANTAVGNAAGDPLYAQVEQLMRTKYLRADELNNDSMLFGAIGGMVASAGDPYTAFFDPEQNQASEEQLSGKYSGIGAELGYNEDKQIVVVAPIKGTPAEAAGLMAGDLIVAIDNESIKGLTLNEVVLKIRGEAGTDVVLTVLPKGATETKDITITRKQITIKTVELEFKDGIAYVSLSRFGETTDAEWATAVSEIVAKGSTSMILDMRNNPGGYLDTAITIGSEFFKDGIIVGQEDASGSVDNFEATGRGRLTDIKVTVLVNGGSASASEIVAGALKSRDRADIVGMKSFGKGTVQQVIDLARDTSLHVTIAKWILPNGDNIDKQGISPDIEVDMTSEDVQADRDPQLDRAMQEAKK